MRRSQRLWLLAAAILAVTILETVRLPADEPDDRPKSVKHSRRR